MKGLDFYTVGERAIYPFSIPKHPIVAFFSSKKIIPDESCSLKASLQETISDREFQCAIGSDRDSSLIFKTEEDARTYAQANRIYHRQAFDDYSELPVYKVTFKYDFDYQVPQFTVMKVAANRAEHPLTQRGNIVLDYATVNRQTLSYTDGNLKIVDPKGNVVKSYEADGGALLIRNFPMAAYLSKRS